jgi:DNA repair protein RadC
LNASIKLATHATDYDQAIITQALTILDARLRSPGPRITQVSDTINYLRMQFDGLKSEVFGCMFLSSQNKLIQFEKLFTGTVNGCSVHPREVVKSALEHNAATVIFAHNHPSGSASPSEADKQITVRLTDALSLIDITVIDHVIIAGAKHYSFAEDGAI